MELDKFWDFINLVYTNAASATAKGMCDGEINYSQWSENYTNLRREFEKCVFENTLVNKEFKEMLYVYQVKFQRLVNSYKKSKWIGKTIDIKDDKFKHYVQLYHKTRYKEVKSAEAYLTLILVDYAKEILEMYKSRTNEKDKQPNNTENDNNQVLIDDIVIPHEKTFKENYNDDKLKYIYDYIIKVGYLDVDTPFENFKYCITGKGTPTSGLVWKGGADILAYFIDGICKLSKHQWVKGKAVFGIKVANSNMNNSQKEDPFKQLKKDIGII